jgi:hypothetical protein
MKRRLWLVALILLSAGAGYGVNHAPAGHRPADGRLQQIERALARALNFLVSHQSTDGAWRSDTYGTFKDGSALTPLALVALQDAGPVAETADARSRAAAYLAGLVRPDGTIDGGPAGLDYPLYTAASSVVALSGPGTDKYKGARYSWLAYLTERQLDEKLGWQPADKEYGGWGYCRGLPRKPTPGVIALPLIESNLSATVAALEGVCSAARLRQPILDMALVFVRRCQNWPADGAARDEHFDDGGFFFIYDDPVRNKAGVAGTDRQGRQRFASYGSTTADGLRALLLCGVPPTDERVIAARRWLEAHFAAGVHPGAYVERHVPNRMGVYFYYCRSLSAAFRQLGLARVSIRHGGVDWAAELADDLLKRQRDDGSWLNPIQAQREDEPLVATAFAVQALANCRAMLRGEAAK